MVARADGQRRRHDASGSERVAVTAVAFGACSARGAQRTSQPTRAAHGSSDAYVATAGAGGPAFRTGTAIAACVVGLEAAGEDPENLTSRQVR